jgi:N-glycosidase YbiA
MMPRRSLTGATAKAQWVRVSPKPSKLATPRCLRKVRAIIEAAFGDWNGMLVVSVNAEYGCFSNFSPHPIRMKGKNWPTSEHYFQAQKFAGTPDEEEVRQAKSPMVAARMGRSRKRPLRKDWESVKDSLMYEAVLAKFSQHAELRETILATGDSTIVEHTTNDAYWGDGGDGSGKNRLGETLMRVRELLRQSEQG